MRLGGGGAPLSLREVAALMHQLLQAVHCLHAIRLVHRDVKPANLLFSAAGELRLIDFGLSFRWPGAGPHKPLTKLAGSLHYMAPEMLARTGYLGSQVDAWSLGVIVATMLAGQLPFRGETDSAIKKAVMRGVYTLPDFQPPISGEGAQLVAALLTINPEGRLAVADAHAHPWFDQPRGETEQL